MWRSVSAGLRNLVAVGLALCSAQGVSHPMRFDRFGLDEGLSQQNVMTITQDPSGFLWFGTEDGLNRYDGYGFEHVRSTRGRPDGLAGNYITDVVFDSAGNMWVATDGGGIAVRDAANGRFSRILGDTRALGGIGLDRVRVMRFDRSGDLWIGTREHGVVFYSPRSHLLRRFTHSGEGHGALRDDSIFALLPGQNGRLWIGTAGGVDVLDPRSGGIESHSLEISQAAADGIAVRALLQDHLGVIWFGTSSGLESFEPRTGVSVVFRHDASNQKSLPAGGVSVLLEDGQGRLWIGTPQGLALFDRVTRTFESYRSDPTDPGSLPDDEVVSLFEDRGGLLWVGTKTGVAKWNPRSWSFGHHLGGAADGMPSRYVNAFTEDHLGRLWVGSLGGVTLVEPRSGRTLTLQHHEGRADGLSDDRVMALLTARDGSVWVGTMGGGLDRFDPLSLRATVYRHEVGNPGSLGASGVMSLLQDSQRRVWVGTFGGGLDRLEPDFNTWRHYRLPSGRVTALAEDARGCIWAGTDGGGVSLIDPRGDRLVTLRHHPRDPTTLSSDTIYALHVDPRGTVWIGTRDGGLDRAIGGCDGGAALRFVNLSEANGLPNNTVYGIRSDSSGQLWLSTNHGLARLEPHSGVVRSFHRSQGLQGEEFNFGAHYRTSGGELLFGGAKGFNQFDPARLQFDRTVAPLALTALFEVDRPVQGSLGLEHLGRLHLGYQDDVVTFEFAALDFTAPLANTFQYQLVGFDREWVGAGARRSVTYTHLAAGSYVLHARAANPEGVWGDAGWQFVLDVDPPPWRTGWAYFGYTLLVLGALGAGWSVQRRRLGRERQYQAQLEQEVRDRTQELAQRNADLQGANSKLAEANSMLEEISLTDTLTGLGNRRSLQHAMPQLLAGLEDARSRSRGLDGRLAIMVVDLDHFKPINDTHGHEAGDRVLQQISAILCECVREQDKVVRWGGDEFVIVHGVCGLDGAAALAERIREAVAKKRFRVSDTQIARTSVSIGFACHPFVAEAPHLLSWEDALHLADTALYRAKATRNCWVGWSGTRAAMTLSDLTDRIESDADLTESEGYIEWRFSERRAEGSLEMALRASTTASVR